MKSGWDDGFAVNPWSPQQQIVGRVNIDAIICHLRFQIPSMASELDFAHRAGTLALKQ